MLHQHVAEIAEPRFTPLRLLIEPRVGIRRRAVGLVRPALPMEIHRRIPPTAGGGGSSSRGRKLL